MKQIIKLTEQDLHNIIKESVNTIISESFRHWQSPKLAELIKQHGMPKGKNGQMSRNYFLTQLRDDNIEGITDKPLDGDKLIELGDGTKVIYNTKDNEVARDWNGLWSGMYNDKYIDKVRPNNGFAHVRANNNVPVDYYARAPREGEFDPTGDRRFHYSPSTTKADDARDLRFNPYFINGKNKEYNPNSGWNRKEADRVMNNLKSGKDKNGNENKPRY